MRVHLPASLLFMGALAAVSCGSTPKAAEPELEKKMMNIVHKSLDALVAGDVDTFLESFADDAIILDENGPVGKKQLAGFFKGVHFKHYKIEDVKFRPLPGGAGILSYRNKSDGFIGKQPVTFDAYVTLVFKPKGNRLLTEFVQETNVKGK